MRHINRLAGTQRRAPGLDADLHALTTSVILAALSIALVGLALVLTR